MERNGLVARVVAQRPRLGFRELHRSSAARHRRALKRAAEANADGDLAGTTIAAGIPNEVQATGETAFFRPLPNSDRRTFRRAFEPILGGKRVGGGGVRGDGFGTAERLRAERIDLHTSGTSCVPGESRAIARVDAVRGRRKARLHMAVYIIGNRVERRHVVVIRRGHERSKRPDRIIHLRADRHIAHTAGAIVACDRQLRRHAVLPVRLAFELHAVGGLAGFGDDRRKIFHAARILRRNRQHQLCAGAHRVLARRGATPGVRIRHFDLTAAGSDRADVDKGIGVLLRCGNRDPLITTERSERKQRYKHPAITEVAHGDLLVWPRRPGNVRCSR